MKGGSLFHKYLNNPEANSDAFENGWLRTGDVGMVDEEGRLWIVDRIKNIFKLQQGEYVSPEAVEKVTQSSAIVLQSFLTGNSQEANTVMVVVPEPKNVDKLLIAKGCYTDEQKDNFTLAQKIENHKELIKEEVKDQIKAVLKGSTLKPFEKPHYAFLTANEMNVDNNCMTPTFKIRRNFAAKM